MILPYVYRLTHKISGHFYIGYRYGNLRIGTRSENDLGVVYFTSSKLIGKKNIHDYTIEILAEFYTSNDAYDFEQALIREYWDNDLLINDHFHCNGAGRWKNPGHTTETRKKISEARKGYKATDEVKQNMSSSRKGRKLSDEAKKNMSLSKTGNKNPNYGKSPSAETRLKQSISTKGRPGRQHSEATRQKMSEDRKGRPHAPHSEETKSKIAEAHRGKSLSAETKEKISKSKKGKPRNNKPT